MRFDDIITQSPLFEAVIRASQLIARTDATVLITGESGTGKECLAQAMHQASRRHDQPIICINCATLPEHLAESLLFGHQKGAFTGATQQAQGLITSAHNGTLFLDEIAELPLPTQAKLLRFLELGTILPLGSTQEVRINTRIISATHRDLYQCVENGSFRQDLFYRLNVVPVEIPSLRERKEDIKPLTQYFLKQFAAQHQLPIATLSKTTLKHLQKQRWSGNVRELRNLCERLSILLAGQIIEPSNLPLDMQTLRTTQPKTFELPDHGVNLESLECDLLNQALQRSQQNKSHAARLLGISRDAFNYRMKKYRLL